MHVDIHCQRFGPSQDEVRYGDGSYVTHSNHENPLPCQAIRHSAEGCHVGFGRRRCIIDDTPSMCVYRNEFLVVRKEQNVSALLIRLRYSDYVGTTGYHGVGPYVVEDGGDSFTRMTETLGPISKGNHFVPLRRAAAA